MNIHRLLAYNAASAPSIIAPTPYAISFLLPAFPVALADAELLVCAAAITELVAVPETVVTAAAEEDSLEAELAAAALDAEVPAAAAVEAPAAQVAD